MVRSILLAVLCFTVIVLMVSIFVLVIIAPFFDKSDEYEELDRGETDDTVFVAHCCKNCAHPVCSMRGKDSSNYCGNYQDWM